MRSKSGQFVKIKGMGDGRVLDRIDGTPGHVRIVLATGEKHLFPEDRITLQPAERYNKSKAYIFTIGYEGLSLDTFLELLVQHKVACLLDIRRNPVSRKRGFSKNALRVALESEGIEYVHVPEWGAPKDLHDRLRANLISYPDFFLAYRNAIKPRVKEIRARARSNPKARIALMCFEHEPFQCHRSVVADLMASADGGFVGHIVD